jgi:hypothetical protein
MAGRRAGHSIRIHLQRRDESFLRDLDLAELAHLLFALLLLVEELALAGDVARLRQTFISVVRICFTWRKKWYGEKLAVACRMATRSAAQRHWR